MNLDRVFLHPTLRRAYWLLRAPFSPFAAYRFATESLAAALFAKDDSGSGYRVATGPFKGMVHTRSGSGVNLPCLAGCFEHEIHDWIEEVVASDYDLIVDIGCAEGYYASGFALRTRRRVIACDINARQRSNCARMARLNAVDDLVHVRDGLTHESLELVLAEARRPFVFCDIEGAEETLLDPERVPALAHTDVIVEIHGEPAADTLSSLEARFTPTHSVRTVSFQPLGLGWVTGELRDFLAPHLDRHAEALILSLAEPRRYSRWAFFKLLHGGAKPLAAKTATAN